RFVDLDGRGVPGGFSLEALCVSADAQSGHLVGGGPPISNAHPASIPLARCRAARGELGVWDDFGCSGNGGRAELALRPHNLSAAPIGSLDDRRLGRRVVVLRAAPV